MSETEIAVTVGCVGASIGIVIGQLSALPALWWSGRRRKRR